MSKRLNSTPIGKREPGIDRRVKLTEAQRAEIAENAEGLSTYALADKYGCSRRLVSFIQNPEKLAENRAKRKERGATYYDKAKHREATRAHRKHKRELIEKGLI